MNEFLRFAFGLSRPMLLTVVAIGAVSGLLGAALIAVVGQMFANMSELEDREILAGAFSMVGLALLVIGLELLAKRLLVRHSARCAAELRQGLAATLLKDPLRKTEEQGSARLMAAYTEDIRALTLALNQIPAFGIAVFVIVGCMGYLFWLSPSVFLILFALALPSVAVSMFVHRRSKALSKETLQLRNVQVSAFRSMISGLKELQLNRASCRRYFDEVFSRSVKEHESVYVRSMLMFSINSAWTQFVYFLSITAVLIYMVASDLGPDVIAPYVVVALYMKGYVAQLLGTVPTWSQAGAIVEQLRSKDYLSLDRTLPERSAAPFRGTGKPVPLLEARGLVYSYRDERSGQSFTVGPLEIDFHAGELVFIVGHNGAGKSTLVKLLSGLYDCDAGTLRYAGVDVDDGNRESYRQLFSVIFTVPFVFDELPLDGEGADAGDREARVRAYLERLGLQYKVQVEDGRLTTVDLSHGQRKRLALLGAYLEDRPVVVFDEWAENQDPAFKDVFYKELLPELRARGKLVIVVSHESQYFHVADRIVTLNAPDASSNIASDVAVEVPAASGASRSLNLGKG